MSDIVRGSFKNTKKYVWKGAFAFLFYFCAVYTLKDGILPLMANTFPGQERRQGPSNNPEAHDAPDGNPSDPTSVDSGTLVEAGKPYDENIDTEEAEAEEIGDEEAKEEIDESEGGEGAEGTADVGDQEDMTEEDGAEEEEIDPGDQEYITEEEWEAHKRTQSGRRGGLTEFEKSLDIETYGYTPSIFHLGLPIAVFTYHYQLKHIEQKFEHPLLVYIKIGLCFIFSAIILTTFAVQTLFFKIMTGVSLLVAPVLLIIYTYGIFNIACMSGNRSGSCRARTEQANR